VPLTAEDLTATLGSEDDTTARGDLLRSLAHAARERCNFRSRGEAVFVMLRPLMPALVAAAERRGSPEEAYKVSEEAVTVLHELHCALVPYWDPKNYSLDQPMRVHASDDVSAGTGPYDGFAGGFNLNHLEAAAASYLARPWMAHDYLDWCLVDAMVRREWAAFDYAVRNNPPREPLGSSRLTKLLGWLLEGAIATAVVWWLRRSYTNDDPYFFWWGAAAAIYYGYVFLASLLRIRALRSLRRAQGEAGDPKVISDRIWMKMKLCYRELDGPILSPTRVRDVLRSGEALGTLNGQAIGILWPTAMWPILEAAIARNPTVWNVSSKEWCD
jgi:hypothetical protein